MSRGNTRKLLVGLTAVSGVATFYYLNNWTTNHREKLFTTNYSPTSCIKWDYNWDDRANQSNEREAKFSRHMLLIRHGQYNMKGSSDLEKILTETGRLQAEYAGKRLKEMDLPYTEMVKSTMARAQETGSIISEHISKIPIESSDLLREGTAVRPDPFEGDWQPNAEEASRIETAFRKYFHRADPKQEKDSCTILVCHSNVIRYFICRMSAWKAERAVLRSNNFIFRALQLPPEAWLRISLSHGSITWITITTGGLCILRGLGDTGHMPPSVITKNYPVFSFKNE